MFLHTRPLYLTPRGIPSEQTNIVFISVARNMLWVGTNGGYFFGFHAVSCDLLVMSQHHMTIEDMVLLSNHRQMVTFGKLNSLQGISDDNNGSFMVWELHTHPEDNSSK